MSGSNISHDILNREIHFGDLVLLYNDKYYLPTLAVSQIGLAIGRYEYMVYDNDDKVTKTVCTSVYLLDTKDEEVSKLKTKMLSDYQEYQFKQLKSATDKEIFKSKSKVHKPGDVFLTKDNKAYLYIGRYSLTVKYRDKNDKPLIESAGHTYLYLPEYLLNVLEDDIDWMSIQGTLMSYYIPYSFNLSDYFMCFKRFSGRFVDYYKDGFYKIVDGDETFVHKTKFFKECWPHKIEISLKPLDKEK